MVTKTPKRVPSPQNRTARLPGAPTPPSAAATEAQPGPFYSAEPRMPQGYQAPRSPLGGDFNDRVREGSLPNGNDRSADVELSEHAAAAPENDRAKLLADIARIRQFRKPLGAYSQKLALEARPGYHRHWFNDVAGRIQEAEANGWAFVKDSDGHPINRCVGTGRDKGAMYAFAMELPLVFWQEDMDARHEAASAKIEALKAAPFRSRPGEAQKADKGKFYDPSESSEGPLQVVKG